MRQITARPLGSVVDGVNPAGIAVDARNHRKQLKHPAVTQNTLQG